MLGLTDLGASGGVGEVIRDLDARTIQLIIGGEVYVRPLSIVKELLDNAIDADATNIQVKVTNGGFGSVMVVDNGRGIRREDFDKICKPNYTTKVCAHTSSSESVNVNHSTLGFRGEALCCLTYLADVTIYSKSDGELMGSKGLFKDGVLVNGDIESLSLPHIGSTVEVMNVYKVHKVRRQKKDAIQERNAIAAYLTDMKVFYSDLVITFTAEKQTIYLRPFKYPDRSFDSRVGTLLQLFPGLNNSQLRSINITTGWGVVSGIYMIKRPIQIPSNSSTGGSTGGGTGGGTGSMVDNRFITFINRRPVSWPSLKKAIMKIYESYMSSVTNDNLVLFWDVTLYHIDDNIDRLKLSVAIQDEQYIIGEISNRLDQELKKSVNIMLTQSVHNERSERVDRVERTEQVGQVEQDREEHVKQIKGVNYPPSKRLALVPTASSSADDALMSPDTLLGNNHLMRQLEYIGTADMKTFVLGSPTHLIVANIASYVKKVILPQNAVVQNLVPPLNLSSILTATFMDLNNNVVIKNNVLYSLPRYMVKTDLTVWIDILLERSLASHRNQPASDGSQPDDGWEMLLKHEASATSHYAKFSCGQSLWNTWLKNASSEGKDNVDELVISPPLKTILKCFERC